MATIAIDFDDTYTLDRPMWDRFIADAQSNGHRVICVTARRDTPENRDVIQIPNVTTFFTSLSSKRWYVETKWNIKVDVWIDDRPEVVINGF